eukprot:294454-Pleurochrysis_carterae.AAC.2
MVVVPSKLHLYRVGAERGGGEGGAKPRSRVWMEVIIGSLLPWSMPKTSRSRRSTLCSHAPLCAQTLSSVAV